MIIVLGASGHIGSALAKLLLERAEGVLVVLHDARKAHAWEQHGAQAAVLDMHETAALHRVFARGKRLFLLNPPAAPSTDTDHEERVTLRSILSALAGSGLEKIVAESSYGAQAGAHIGDLGTLYELEQALAAQPIPSTVIRAAYYMSNWEAALASARAEGVLHTFYPVDFAFPMVAPQDIAALAAQLISAPLDRSGLHHVEGPERYTSEDVARTLSKLLGKPVRAVQTPESERLHALRAMGFSAGAAESFSAMTDLALHAKYPDPSQVSRGPTSLEQFLSALTAKG